MIKFTLGLILTGGGYALMQIKEIPPTLRRLLTVVAALGIILMLPEAIEAVEKTNKKVREHWPNCAVIAYDNDGKAAAAWGSQSCDEVANQVKKQCGNCRWRIFNLVPMALAHCNINGSQYSAVGHAWTTGAAKLGALSAGQSYGFPRESCRIVFAVHPDSGVHY